MERKIIGLNKGIHRSPTSGEPGELMECMNLIVRNNEIMNAPVLVDEGTTIPSGYTLKYIHKTSFGKMFVLQKDSKLYYMKEGGTSVVGAGMSEYEKSLKYQELVSDVATRVRTLEDYIVGLKQNIARGQLNIKVQNLLNMTGGQAVLTEYQKFRSGELDEDEWEEYLDTLSSSLKSAINEIHAMSISLGGDNVSDAASASTNLTTFYNNLKALKWEKYLQDYFTQSGNYYDTINHITHYQAWMAANNARKYELLANEHFDAVILGYDYSYQIMASSDYLLGAYKLDTTNKWLIYEENATGEDRRKNPSSPLYVVKIAESGKTSWQILYNEDGTPEEWDTGIDLATDSNGNLIREFVPYIYTDYDAATTISKLYNAIQYDSYYDDYMALKFDSSAISSMNAELSTKETQLETLREGEYAQAMAQYEAAISVVNPFVICESSNIKDITSVGNVLCVAHEEGIRYAICKNNTYTLFVAPKLDVKFKLGSTLASNTEYGVYKYQSEKCSYGFDMMESDYVNIHNHGKVITDVPILADMGLGYTGNGWAFNYRKGVETLYTTYAILPGETIKKGTWVKIIIREIQSVWYRNMSVFFREREVTDNSQNWVNVKKEGEVWTFEHFTNGEVISFYIMYNSISKDAKIDNAVLRYEIYTASEEAEQFSIKNDDDKSFVGIMGSVDKFVKQQSVEKNKFLYPFFVRYGLRMYDGTIIYPSSPILMQPNTGRVPLCIATGINENTNTSSGSTTTPAENQDITTCAFVSDLYYKVISDESELKELCKNSELIKEVVIAISNPIYTYNSGEKYDAENPKVRIKRVNLYDSFDKDYGIGMYPEQNTNSDLTRRIPLAAALNKYLTPNGKGKTSYLTIEIPYYSKSKIREQIENTANFYNVYTVELDNLEVNSYSKVVLEDGVLEGITGRETLGDNYTTLMSYCPENIISYNNRLVAGNISERQYIGHNVDAMIGDMYSKFLALGKVSSSSQEDVMYFTDSTRFNTSMVTQYGSVVEFSVEDTAVKLYRPISKDAYMNAGHGGVRWFFYPNTNAKRATIYRRRKGDDCSFKGKYTGIDDICKSTIELRKHPYLNGAYWFGNFDELSFDESNTKDITYCKKLTLTDYTNADSVKISIKKPNGDALDNSVVEESCVYSSSKVVGAFPKGGSHTTNAFALNEGEDYMLVTEATCKIVIEYYNSTTKLGEKSVLSSTIENTILSYGLTEDEQIILNMKSVEVVAPVKHNKIMQSNANNPFFMDANSANYIGNGDIRALSVATMAVDKEQHGAAPIMCFSTDGIWGVGVNGDGTFSAKQPVSRDVIKDKCKPCQTDGSIIFAAEDGIKILESEGVKDISKELNGILDIEKIDLNKLSDWNALTSLTEIPFSKVMSDCSMLFDTQNKSLHVYSGQCSGYHYVYSMEEQQWTKVSGGSPASIVKGYPYNLVQVGQNVKRYKGVDEVLDVSSTSTTNDVKRRGVLLTREMSFDNPVAMKMLHDLRVLRKQQSSTTKVVVWVSDDREHWKQLGSLKHSSWKWYRFALYTDMTDVEGIEGIVCDIEERRTNKLR